MKGRIKRQEIVKSNIPIIGKIKVGEKTASGYPRTLDYFKCQSKYCKLFEEAYGQKPNKIELVFISDNWEDSCDERYEARDKEGRLSGKGDGEEWWIWNGAKYVQTTDQQQIKNAGKWEIVLTIKFIILGIKGVMGLFSFTTKAKASSINSIRDTFDMVLKQAGTVINIPFDLTVEKVKSQKPGEKSSYPVVNLVPNISKDNMDQLHQYLESGKDIRSLPASEIKKLINN